jgi:hypothetical protein
VVVRAKTTIEPVERVSKSKTASSLSGQQRMAIIVHEVGL